jgi:hypothetical protein
MPDSSPPRRPAPTTRSSTLLAAAASSSAAFAPYLRHATGIDMTPAMLDRARALAAEKGLGNVAWRERDVAALP